MNDLTGEYLFSIYKTIHYVSWILLPLIIIGYTMFLGIYYDTNIDGWSHKDVTEHKKIFSGYLKIYLLICTGSLLWFLFKPPLSVVEKLLM